MKTTNRYFLMMFCLLILSSGTAFPQITTRGIEQPSNYDSLIPPNAGASVTDPVFGSTITRVTGALSMQNHDQGGALTWIENEYATVSPFNSDNSKFILLHQSYFGLYDGHGTYLKDLPMAINSSSEPRWSRSDNVTLYYHATNQLKSYNTSTGGMRVVHTFTEYTAISGNGEMDISYDGDHLVFAGDNRYVFVYQIGIDKMHQVFDTQLRPFDSMYITPSNNIIISWLAAGTTRYTGQELFDINMNFLRQVGHADGHKDVTRDTNGDEVLIWTNSADPAPIANCANGIVKIRLADGTQTCLLQLDWSLSVHISAPDGNGSVFVDTEAPKNLEPAATGWVAYTDELLQVRLDGSAVTRWGHHRSRPVGSYNWQPKLSSSRDGTRVLYASNFNLLSISGNPVDYADTYMLNIGTAPTSGAPESASTGASTTVPSTPDISPAPTSGAAGSNSRGLTTTTRYQQGDPSLTYTDTWYTNNGSFNSGGSATMAVDAKAAATFSFSGTGVNWIGFSDAWSGIADVYMDGVLIANVDTYLPAQTAQRVTYSASNLSEGAHTLKIMPAGKNINALGGWIWIDAFDVIGPSVPASIAGVFNAASFAGGSLTADSYASLFGNNLASHAGDFLTSVTITDSAGITFKETPIYVSPGQVNFLVSGGLAPGAATLSVGTSAGLFVPFAIMVAISSPGLFSADGSGRGPAAGQALTARTGDAVKVQPLAECGAGGCVSATVPLSEGVPEYLILYGTGVRGARSVSVTIGGIASSIAYAGAQGTYPGLDQINILLPSSLAGKGDADVILTADGKPSNPLAVRF